VALESLKKALVHKEEEVTIDLGTITITLNHSTTEVGSGGPAFKMVARRVRSVVQNWSSNVTGSASLSVTAAYFNKKFNVWEYVLEPLEEQKGEFCYWSMTAEINPTQDLQNMKGSRLIPKMLCSVYSKESLQITLSRTSIGQLLNLVDEYSKPMESEGRALRSAREGVVQSGRSTYKLRNMLGEQYKVTVQAKDALAEVEGQNTEKTLKDGQEAIFVSMVTHSEDPSAGLLKQEIKQLVWSVRVGGFHARHILFTGFNKTYYPLKPLKESSSQSYGFVVEAEPFSQNVTMVTIRSPVQILNNMAEPCMVAMTMSSGLTSEAVAKAMVVNPGEKIPLSLSVAHEGHTFVKQQSKDIKYSTTSIRWNSKSEKTTVVCPVADGSPSGPPGHYIRVVVVKETDLAKAQLVDMTQRAHHILSLNYPIVICNNLPYRSIVSSSLVPKLEMKRGGSVPIGTCALDEDKHLFSKQPKVSLTLTVFMEGGPWNGSLVIEPEEDKMNVFNVQREKNERTLAVSSEDRGSWRVTLFAPYWMVNKSGVTLDYSIPGGLSFSKSEAVITQTCQQKITFLKLSDDLFKRSTELKIRISKMEKAEPSTWSKAFSLDTAGFCGVIKIEHKSKIHHFGVEVHLSKHGLTKIITISPFFLLENLTNHRITCFEPTVGDKKPSSITVDKKKMVTFHPSVNAEKLQIALDNQKSLSLPFKFTAPSTVLIRTTGDAPAVVAQVKVTTHATLITFSPYYHGAATFLIVNDLKDLTMEFQQNAKEKKAMKNIHVVLPGHTLLYTWDIPDARKELKFWIRGRESKTFLLQPQDACGKFKLPRGFKKWLVYERTARAMMSHGGSRRTDSFYGSYSAPPTPVESEVSGSEDVDGETVAHDRWRQYDEGSSGEDAYDSDLELEETDSEPSTPIKKRQRLKKFFSFGRSTQDLDQSLVDKIKGRWVSFMDNIQRVLLFTLDKDRIVRAQQGQLIQTPDLGVTTSLHSGGLSLVDDIIGKEVSYIGISPCPVVWEWEKRTGYWRPLFTMNAAALEAAYQKYIEASSSAKPTPQTPNSLAVQTVVLQEEEWKVSFGESISMSKVKENEEHGLRRSSSPGIFFKYTTSTNQITLRAKVFSLQVDNQLPNVKFPQVVYGIPPPPSIASSMEPKPLLDTSIIIRKAGKEGTTEYKLIQFVLQKIGIEVELGFLVALSRLFAGWKRPMTDRDTIEADITRVKVDDLKEMLLPALAAEEKSFIDNIMLSPVHIALSLSLSQSSSSEEMQMDPSEGIFGGFDPLAPLRSFLKSFGAFVVDVKGSELKLNRLEGSQLVLTHPELIQMVRHHYTQQVLREVYKAVLNLNVIGNPVSLVGGVASGVTDLFYEPYKAVTLGPEEFVEAVGIGVHSAIGGTVGGALGVVSTFTGKLGDAAALFSRDKDERERRRSDNRELSITYGLGGLIKDFGGAVTNVVVQPVKGAQSEGVIGFLKGTGRGIFGIALRPLGGALDLTTIAVDKLKRVTKIDDYEMVQLRLPRYIGPDQVIRPYSLYSATGKAFLEDLEPSPSDDLFYLTHFEIEADPMKAFLLTTKYALQFSQVGKLDILKKWDRDLEIVYDKVIESTLRSEGRMFKVKVKKDSAFSKLFSSKDEEELTVQLRTPQDAKEAAEAFCQALKKYKLNKV
jgi:vacuolar protein sorting-associated protein 13A/C